MATQSTKIHFYIFMVLIFFLCLLSFSVGTFVGKTFTEDEYRKSHGEISSRLNASRGVASEESKVDEKAEDEDSDKDNESLTNEEIDQLAAEFADESQEDAPTVTETKTTETKEITNTSPIADVTQRISEDKSPTAKEVKKRKPSAVLPNLAASSLGKFTVQIASYTNEAEAEAHAAKLKERGYSAFYVPAKVRKKKWFRVSIGLFEKSETANAFRKKFIKKNYLETAIIQKITQ